MYSASSLQIIKIMKYSLCFELFFGLGLSKKRQITLEDPIRSNWIRSSFFHQIKIYWSRKTFIWRSDWMSTKQVMYLFWKVDQMILSFRDLKNKKIFSSQDRILRVLDLVWKLFDPSVWCLDLLLFLVELGSYI